jgi:hypothetical protein
LLRSFSFLYSSIQKAPLCKQYQLLKYTRDKRREGMIINVTEWNRRKRRENILMAGVISPDITLPPDKRKCNEQKKKIDEKERIKKEHTSTK